MEKKVRKLVSLTALWMLAAPVMADWPVAVTDKFTVHQDHVFTELDLLKNDVGSNLKVVDVNEWSENGGRLSLRTYDRSSRDQYHAYGDVSYIPSDDFVGEDAFWYVVEDDQGRRNAIRSTIDVKPSELELPTPLQDFIDVPKDMPTRIDVLANDLFSSKFTGRVNTFRGQIVNFNMTTTQGGTVEKVEVSSQNSLSFGPFRYGGYSIENTLKYQFKYTPPAGFVGEDSFTYSVRDSTDQYNKSINDLEKWTKVTLNVADDGAIAGAWPVANPDTVTVDVPTYPGLAYYVAPEFNVTKNDVGENLLVTLNSPYSEKGANVSVIPNYPNRPFIRYSANVSNHVSGASYQDRVWYVIEDAYGRKNFSYMDVTVNML